MKIEIKIEADNDAMEKIQKQFGAVAARISTVIDFFEQKLGLSLTNSETDSNAREEMAPCDVATEEEAASEQRETEKDGHPVPVSDEMGGAPDTDSVQPSESAFEDAPVPPLTSMEKEPQSVPAEPEKKSAQKTKQGASKKAKSRVKKNASAKVRQGTAAGTVLELIKKSKNGVDSKTLQEKTGFKAKKVADTVYQLKKKGLIKKGKKGHFTTI